MGKGNDKVAERGIWERAKKEEGKGKDKGAWIWRERLI